MQTQNVDMAWELISLGEPTNIVIQDVQNRMTLGLFYVGHSKDGKRVDDVLQKKLLEDINEQDSS